MKVFDVLICLSSMLRLFIVQQSAGSFVIFAPIDLCSFISIVYSATIFRCPMRFGLGNAAIDMH